MDLAAAAIGLDNGAVLIAITVIVLPIAAIAFARSGPAWKELGRGPFSVEREAPNTEARGPAPETQDGAQEAEVRQMIEAKSYRRQRRGEAPIDVDAEARAALDSAPPQPAGIEEELRAEVRQLVLARNERRLRAGQAPLDVEAETKRQLADFIGSG
jgi:hypothetical protein